MGKGFIGGEIVAEFVQTMKDWRRMCKDRRCDVCRLRSVDGICNTDPYSRTDEDIIKIENTVTEWAAENPEPVYPSWIDWLMSEGVIPTNYMAANSTDSEVRAGMFYVTSKAFEHIPADIAAKLEIEPKEVKHEDRQV